MDLPSILKRLVATHWGVDWGSDVGVLTPFPLYCCPLVLFLGISPKEKEEMRLGVGTVS